MFRSSKRAPSITTCWWKVSETCAHFFPAGRDVSFGLYESAGGGRIDRSLLPVIDRSVSGDLHHRHVSYLVLEVQSHRAADSADDRQRGAAFPADGAHCRPHRAAV